MISKKEFLRYIDAIKKYNEFESDLYDNTHGAFNLLEIEPLVKLHTCYIEMLSEGIGDKIGMTDDRGYPIPSDLEYFIYDVEFGKRADTYYLTDADGVEHHWHNPEEFYDYMVSINEERANE